MVVIVIIVDYCWLLDNYSITGLMDYWITVDQGSRAWGENKNGGDRETDVDGGGGGIFGQILQKVAQGSLR